MPVVAETSFGVLVIVIVPRGEPLSSAASEFRFSGSIWFGDLNIPEDDKVGKTSVFRTGSGHVSCQLLWMTFVEFTLITRLE